jgi:myo-inositol-1(or 4)-monophosphatase
MTQSPDELRPETLVAIDAVTRALTIARRGVGAKDITAKVGRDLVTATDIAVEDAVRGIVADALGFSVIGEERGGEASADGSPYWLVDPICGTRNFASGIPLYCVNLALVEDHEVTVAVVGDPSTGEIDVAERGGGAWRLKDGARHRMTTSDASRTIVIASPAPHPGELAGHEARVQAAARQERFVAADVRDAPAVARYMGVTGRGWSAAKGSRRPTAPGRPS